MRSKLALIRRWSAAAMICMFGDDFDRRAVRMLASGELPDDEAANVRAGLDSMWRRVFGRSK